MIVQKPDPKRPVRLNGKKVQIIPHTKPTIYGDRNITVFAPFIWNQLPLHMHICDDLNAFKTYLEDTSL